jgi:uncharacterized SAM-binding protein YcdF (DUF218 family)
MDTALFLLGKVVAAAVRPDTWLIAGLALIVVGLARGRTRLARRAAMATLGAALALAVLPVGDLALYPLEVRYPASPPLAAVDGILVLGGAEEPGLTRRWGPVQLNGAAERMTAALALARQHPQARVVFSGGSGALRHAFGGGLPGAATAARFFGEQGLDPARLTLESRSRTTWENAVETRRLLAPDPDETWVLVTSAFHMPRAMQSFAAAGWPGRLVPWPVDHRGDRPELDWDFSDQLLKLQIAVREYAGLIGYALRPAPDRREPRP